MAVRDWADIEAEREVDELTPSVPPMSRPAMASEPGSIYRNGVLAVARALGVDALLVWDEPGARWLVDPAAAAISGLRFSYAPGRHTLFDDRAWCANQHDCVMRLRQVAAAVKRSGTSLGVRR